MLWCCAMESIARKSLTQSPDWYIIIDDLMLTYAGVYGVIHIAIGIQQWQKCNSTAHRSSTSIIAYRPTLACQAALAYAYNLPYRLRCCRQGRHIATSFKTWLSYYTYWGSVTITGEFLVNACNFTCIYRYITVKSDTRYFFLGRRTNWRLFGL